MKLDKAPRRLVVEAQNAQEYRVALGVSGAIPQKDTREVSFPLEPLVVRDLEQELDGLVRLTPEAQTWFGESIAKAQHAVFLSQLEDTTLQQTGAGELYPYQRVGASWLEFMRSGILADEMGLGKTIQSLMATYPSWRVLIITVNLAKRDVWERHLRDWLARPVWVAEGTRQQRNKTIDAMVAHRNGYLVINHEMLRGDAFPKLFSTTWDCVIVDEAHKLQGLPARKRADGKVVGSQQSLGASRLKRERLYLLTGTPVWSKPESIWHLLHLIDPLRFSSYWAFINEYCEVAETPWAKEIVGTKPWMVERLQSVLATLMIRRTKKQVLPELPEKIIQRIEYDLDPAVRKIYRTLKRKLQLLDENGDVVKMSGSAMEAFADLRRLCNAPALLNLNAPSAKDEVIDELLEEALGEEGNRKAIVFCWHKDYAVYLANRLRKYGAVLITGDEPHRQQVVEFFREEPGARVLVATIAAAGIAINLIEANVAIFAEGSHVPTMDAQAEDRLHRIGQKTDVTIYRLAARKTVESALWNTVEDRQTMADEMLSFREVVARTLAEEDE